MNKLGFKSVGSAPEYKAVNKPEDEGVPMPSTDTFDQGDNASMVEDIFNMPSGDATPPPDPLSLKIGGGTPGTTIDPLTGETVEIPNPFYVPSLQEIETKTDADGNTIAFSLNDWNKIEEIYNKKLSEFKKAKNDLVEKLETGLLTPSEAEYVKWLIKSYEESISKIEESLKILPSRIEDLKKLYEDERAEFLELAKDDVAEEFNNEETSATRKAEIVAQILAQADINRDGWIGQPDKKGSLEINEDKNKGWIVYDPFEKRIISKLDPATGEPMSKYWIDGETKKVMKGDILESEKTGSEDLAIEINPWESSSGFLGTDLEIMVPDRIAVQVDAETGKPKSKEATENDIETGFIPAGFELKDGELIQEPPEDKDDYVQVKVTKVEIKTTDEGDHIVKFYSGLDIAAVIRIEKGSEHTVSINGENHEEPLIIDAYKMKSEVKLEASETELKTLYSEYDIKNTDYTSDAFTETMEKFTGLGGEVNDQQLATGIVAYNVSGEVIGTATGNNLVFFKQTNADAYEDGNPNPLFANIFSGGTNSFNAVFNNGGSDFYAKGVTLAYSDNQTSLGMTSIIVNNKLMGGVEVDDDDDDLSDDKPISPKVFVHATGGESEGIFIDNGDETYMDTDGDGAKVNKDDGDYFFTDGQGSYSLPNVPTLGAYDPEADTANPGGVDLNVFGQAINDFEDAVNDMDIEVEDVYELDSPEWTKGEYYSQTSSVMDGFMSAFEAEFGLEPGNGEEDVSIEDEETGSPT